MNTALRRIHPAITLVALAFALLALVAALAGAGYAAATVGANDIKKNAVTAAKIKKNAVTTKKIKKNAVTGIKVKDGSLSLADLPAQQKQTALALGNGGEGDCIWAGGSALDSPGFVLNLGSPAYRVDLTGTVHLSGIALGADGPGGDGACDDNLDQFVTTLPAGAVPAKSLVGFESSGAAAYIIAGAGGIVSGAIVIPPGTVVGAPGTPLSLDGITYVAGGSPLAARKAAQGARSSAAASQMDALIAAFLAR